ncbi:MAG: DUF3459 domain-containing protein [Acaryochloridaceae cyanobacterium CSU_3_4]|nr:DUF3459 domain-containing protein [Acaryochloridaceae cyanobacterium CSU_3_4]
MHWQVQHEGGHAVLWRFYQRLIHLRQTQPALKKLDKTCLQVSSRADEKLILIHRTSAANQVFLSTEL